VDLVKEDEDLQQRKLVEYLAENLGHELCLSLKALVEDTGALRPADNHGVEIGLLAVADAIRDLAEAIRQGNARR
jgi:hypothetical protein